LDEREINSKGNQREVLKYANEHLGLIDLGIFLRDWALLQGLPLD